MSGDDPVSKPDAWKWFLAGFNAASEGWNPTVLTNWDSQTTVAGRSLRDEFELQYPEPTLDVRDSEQYREFLNDAEENGLMDALPTITQTEYDTPINTESAYMKIADPFDINGIVEDEAVIQSIDDLTLELDTTIDNVVQAAERRLERELHAAWRADYDYLDVITRNPGLTTFQHDDGLARYELPDREYIPTNDEDPDYDPNVVAERYDLAGADDGDILDAVRQRGELDAE